MTANLTYTSAPTLGVGFDQKRSSVDGPIHAPGTMVPLLSSTGQSQFRGHFAIYVQANGAIANSAYVTVDLTTTNCYAVSVASLTAGGFCQNGTVAFNNHDWGWVGIVRADFFGWNLITT